MNVVVLVAHGLNCHWLGPYGNEWVATPAIDSLTGESIVFDRHFANEPSHRGFLNSCLVPLWAKLREQKISTTLIEDRRGPFHDGLPWQKVHRTEPKSHSTPAEALAAAIQSAFDSQPHEPGLLWIDTDRLLPPWDFEFETYQQYAEESGGFIENRSTENDQPIDEPLLGPINFTNDALWHRLHNSFAAAVTSFDAEVAGLREAIRRRELDRSTALLFTSSFGMPLGEHGIVGPQLSSLHEELIHLPLVVRLPESREAMRRVAAFTQPSDLPAVILELLGVTTSGSTIGRLISGQIADVRPTCRIETIMAEHNVRALRTIDWAYLAAANGQPHRLYRKPDDVWEVNDLAARHTDECDRMLELLEEENKT